MLNFLLKNKRFQLAILHLVCLTIMYLLSIYAVGLVIGLSLFLFEEGIETTSQKIHMTGVDKRFSPEKKFKPDYIHFMERDNDNRKRRYEEMYSPSSSEESLSRTPSPEPLLFLTKENPFVNSEHAEHIPQLKDPDLFEKIEMETENPEKKEYIQLYNEQANKTYDSLIQLDKIIQNNKENSTDNSREYIDQMRNQMKNKVEDLQNSKDLLEFSLTHE